MGHVAEKNEAEACFSSTKINEFFLFLFLHMLYFQIPKASKKRKYQLIGFLFEISSKIVRSGTCSLQNNKFRANS